MGIKKINIIGFGNVGQNLFSALKNSVEICSVFTKTPSAKKKDLSGNRLVSNLDDLSLSVDLNLICVNDSNIELVSSFLPVDVPVVHTSGSIDKNVLNNFLNYGVLYPLQTFTQNRLIELNEVPFLIESNSDEFDRVISEFVRSNLSGRIAFYNSEERENIHLAAIFVNNFTNLLLRESSSILAHKNQSFDLLLPLLKETVSKIIDISPDKAQTGPAQRGDEKVMNRHLDLLSAERREIYSLLSKRIIDLKINS